MPSRPFRIGSSDVLLATPRRLPRPRDLAGRVVVLDVAFAAEAGGSSFERSTLPFIEALGERLVAWVDHHDSHHHVRFAGDPRFILATKAEHGACPEMISRELVQRVPAPDTIVCHRDFDGLASAAKWLRGGDEPYPGCDEDARAIDTCTTEPSAVGRRLERALRARPRDDALAAQVLAVLLAGGSDAAAWSPIDAAGAELGPLEQRARALAEGYRAVGPELVLVDVTGQPDAYDKTLLLLMGQRRARTAAVVDGDTVTFAAAFDSGVDLVATFGLSGGMPTRVSLRRARLGEALRALGVAGEDADRVAAASASGSTT